MLKSYLPKEEDLLDKLLYYKMKGWEQIQYYQDVKKLVYLYRELYRVHTN